MRRATRADRRRGSRTLLVRTSVAVIACALGAGCAGPQPGGESNSHRILVLADRTQRAALAPAVDAYTRRTHRPVLVRYLTSDAVISDVKAGVPVDLTVLSSAAAERRISDELEVPSRRWQTGWASAVTDLGLPLLNTLAPPP